MFNRSDLPRSIVSSLGSIVVAATCLIAAAGPGLVA